MIRSPFSPLLAVGSNITIPSFTIHTAIALYLLNVLHPLVDWPSNNSSQPLSFCSCVKRLYSDEFSSVLSLEALCDLLVLLQEIIEIPIKAIRISDRRFFIWIDVIFQISHQIYKLNGLN